MKEYKQYIEKKQKFIEKTSSIPNRSLNPTKNPLLIPPVPIAYSIKNIMKEEVLNLVSYDPFKDEEQGSTNDTFIHIRVQRVATKKREENDYFTQKKKN